MSEYWKSTPRYWCKFCKVYVRDTKLERQNHEATGKHQGNVQRGIKDIHRANDKEEREKQRAKAEVARLTGVISGGGSSSGGLSSTQPAPPPPKQQASLEDRKRQMAQLAAMGISIPDEFRKEFAMTGEWQTVRSPVVQVSREKEDAKLDALAVGIRKRQIEAQEEEEEEASKHRKGWGRTFKVYPGHRESGDDDVDALLGGPIKLKNETKDTTLENPEDTIKKEESDKDEEQLEPTVSQEPELAIKAEEPEKPAIDPSIGIPEEQETSTVVPPGTGIVFKKRKSKQVREK